MLPMQMFRQIDNRRDPGGRAPTLPAAAVMILALLPALGAGAAGPAAASGASHLDGGETAAVRTVSLATSGEVEILAGTEVQFLDASIGEVASWSWDFSYDGKLAENESTQKDPVWTYLHAGTWPVRLEVCNEGGCSSVVKEVTVVEPCTIDVDLILPELGFEELASTELYEACRTITTSGEMTVAAGGDVTFLAGRSIALGSGFSVRSGATFVAGVDPVLDQPVP